MKTKFIILLLLILMACGCMSMMAVEGTCVPRSIFAAWTWEQENKLPARIYLFHTDDPWMDHAQAFGYVSGTDEWKPLVIYGSKVDTGQQEAKEPWETRPFRIMTIQEALDEHDKKIQMAVNYLNYKKERQ